VEQALVLGMADVVRAAGLPVMTWSVAGGAAVLGETGSPFNKVIGVGFEGVPDTFTLEAIERAHAARQARLQLELSTLADPAVGRMLTGRGYRLVGFENILARRLDALAASAREGISTTEVGEGDSERWIEAVADGFQHADVFDGPAAHESFDRAMLERTYRFFAAVPGVSRLLAWMEGTVAGGATLYLRDGTAIMCGAATLPASRRRGVQSALLHARLARARAAGCDLAVVTTQPGSKSQENVQRAGFELVYSRAVLVLER
jgi:GNAT superfamily N-acetyltransferase